MFFYSFIWFELSAGGKTSPLGGYFWGIASNSPDSGLFVYTKRHLISLKRLTRAADKTLTKDLNSLEVCLLWCWIYCVVSEVCCPWWIQVVISAWGAAEVLSVCKLLTVLMAISKEQIILLKMLVPVSCLYHNPFSGKSCKLNKTASSLHLPIYVEIFLLKALLQLKAFFFSLQRKDVLPGDACALSDLHICMSLFLTSFIF